MTERVEWTGADGQHHSMSVGVAAEMLKEFDDEWPGGVAEVEASLRMWKKALAEAQHKLDQYKAAFDEWHEKTEWVQETAHWSELGKHRADVLKKRIETLEGDTMLAKKTGRLEALRDCRDMFIPGTVAYKALDEKLVAEIDKPVEL